MVLFNKVDAKSNIVSVINLIEHVRSLLLFVDLWLLNFCSCFSK